MIDLYRRFFDALHDRDVAYGVWKNAQELDDALAGNSDIDLHIPARAQAAFLDELRRHGFVRATSRTPVPGVEHYFGHDELSGQLCHLHCYFRIVTGESHIKQFIVPVDAELDALPSVRGGAGIMELHPLLQWKLHLFRRAIKLSCLPGLLLFLHERDGYAAERELLERRALEYPSDADIGGWTATIEPEQAPMREALAGLRYRWHFRAWNRFGGLRTLIERYLAIARRFRGKLLRRRKTLHNGLTVVVNSSSRAAAAAFEKDLRGWLGRDLQIASFGTTGTSRSRRAAARSRVEGAIVLCHRSSAIDESAVALCPDPDILIDLGGSAESPGHAEQKSATPRGFPHGLCTASRFGAAVRIKLSGGTQSEVERWKSAMWSTIAARQP